MAEATIARRRGRRAAPPPKTTAKHLKLIHDADAKVRAVEAEEAKQAKVVANRVKGGHAHANLTSGELAEILNCSVPMVYKLFGKGDSSLFAPKSKAKATTSIAEAVKKRTKLQTQVSDAKDRLAKRINDAMLAGVATNEIAESLGKSRQMIYKHVRERVDGIKLDKPRKKT